MKQLPLLSLVRTLILSSLLALFFLPVLPVAANEGNPPTPEQIIPGDGKTVYGYLWHDANCDGIRQNSEGPMTDNPRGSQALSLFFVGMDGIPFTNDDKEIGLTGPLNGNIHYLFEDGGVDYRYVIAIKTLDRPAGYTPSLYQQGSDRTIDNDMKFWNIGPNGIWATDAFVIPKLTGFDPQHPAIQGIDIGLCPLANLNLPYAVMIPLTMR